MNSEKCSNVVFCLAYVVQYAILWAIITICKIKRVPLKRIFNVSIKEAASIQPILIDTSDSSS